MSKIRITILLVFYCFVIINSHNPNKKDSKFVATLVTAWWPEKDSLDLTPTGQYLKTFQQLLDLPYNLIVFGENQLQKIVDGKRNTSNTLFIELPCKEIKESWYNKFVDQLLKKGKKHQTVDKANQILRYSRIFLLGRAAKLDLFNSDEFIWIDPNALANFQISSTLDPKNFPYLIKTFKHHFFLLSTQKDSLIHDISNANKNFFNTNISTFVNSQLIGCKKQAMKTMQYIYDDLVRIVVQFDGNLWSEDAILSVMADRCPFLVSFVETDKIKPLKYDGQVLSESIQSLFEDDQQKAQFYEYWTGFTQILIFIIVCFILREFILLLKQVRAIRSNKSEQYQIQSAVSIDRANNLSK